ncbi:hypothetical protein MNBD_GAMMA12-622, partial [hydrothermal vent metagenome]
MEESEKSLYTHFSVMKTARLVELQHSSELSNLALNVLERIFSERGVTSVERKEIFDLIKEKKANTRALATIGSRISAQLIDIVVAYIILFLPITILSRETDAGFIIGVAAYVLYLFFQDGLPNGQSIGKRFIKIG